MRVASRRAISCGISTSVRRGPCGPCCSVAPVGMMTVWCLARKASTSGFVISPRNTVRGFTSLLAGGWLVRRLQVQPRGDFIKKPRDDDDFRRVHDFLLGLNHHEV